MSFLIRLLVVLLLLGSLLIFTAPVKEVKQREIPVSYGKECINGKLYWVYKNPTLGSPFEIPVGDGEGNHVVCSTS